ncbi:MAG: SDR family NAD(P)-dependent oxidoreductase [Acidiferrobacterales bacterium]|nr:SDR family NAD(P)-dependent oxidoreductase [Acidiferrobacterales bacterium]
MTYTLEMSEQFYCGRQAEHVFDYITDFSRIDEWDHTISSAEKVTHGPIGVGTQFDLDYAIGFRSAPISYQIEAFEPSSHAVIVGTSNNFVAWDTINVEPASGGCEVEWHARIEFNGAAESIAPVLRKKILKAGKQTMRDLEIALQDDYTLPSLSPLKTLADKLIVPGLGNFTKFGHSQSSKQWNPVTNSVKGQHMLITGATSGLGLVAATQLAHRGAHLTLVARDEVKAIRVAESIGLQTGNENINIEIADLVETRDVVNLANRLIASGRPIDVLINNAGALFNSRKENNDGIEASFALLLLGPVVLTHLLKPLLNRSKSREHSRIINVSSGGMYATRISSSNLESVHGKYSGTRAYANAKRGLVIMGEEWAANWAKDNIIVHNMHPGWAQTPGVEKSLPEFNRRMQKFLRSPEQGADTITWLACASEVLSSSGLFWLDREPHSTHLSRKTQETSEQRLALVDKLQKYATQYDVDLGFDG